MFIVFLVALNHCLVTDLKWNPNTANYFILALLMTKVFIYFSIETLLMFQYCKFVFTPWVIYALYSLFEIFTIARNNKNNQIYEYNISTNFEVVKHNLNSEMNLRYVKLYSNMYFHSFSLFIIVVLFLFKLVKFLTNNFYFCYNSKKMFRY